MASYIVSYIVSGKSVVRKEINDLIQGVEDHLRKGISRSESNTHQYLDFAKHPICNQILLECSGVLKNMKRQASV